MPLVLALTLASLSPMFVTPAPACATGAQSAALVVDTGGRATRYCVAMDDASVSGIELIELAARQYGLDYRLGYGGAAVCRLDHVGIEGGECFTESDAFWGYWRGSGSGWSWSSTGAASTMVEPGDVEGWAWGTGRDGSTHPAPPTTSYRAACGDAPASPHPAGGAGANGDASAGSGDGGTDGSPAARDEPTGGSPAQASPGPRDGAGEPRPHEAGRESARPGGQADPGSSSPTPTSEGSSRPSPVDATPLAAAPLDRAGPPVAALASAGAAIILLFLAGVLSRRRRPGG